MPYEKVGDKVRCITDEIPFEIPESWEWVRLKNILQVNPRNYLDEDLETGFMPMPLLKEGFNNSHTYHIKKWKDIKSGFTHFADNDVVVAKITPCFQNRKSAVIKNLPNGFGAGTTELHVLRNFNNSMFMPYILLNCKTENFINDGVKNFSGTAGQQRVSKDFIEEYLIPLPPLAEQERIVAKIEEIMPHVEKYGEKEDKLREINSNISKKLKQSILQEAVQGKLVEQDPNDEPASVLLERIKAEKAQLIKDGKIKKDKNESYIFKRDNSHYEMLNGIERCIDEEIPFDIPESWEWVRLKNTSSNIHYGYTASASATGDAKLLRITDIQDNFVEWKNVPFCSIKDTDLPKYELRNRDIMIARTGGTIGKTYIVRNLSNKAVFASYLIRVIPLTNISEEYLKLFMETPLYWQQLTKVSMGTGQPNVNGQALSNLLLPLPPLNEQHQIVSKINNLFLHVENLNF